MARMNIKAGDEYVLKLSNLSRDSVEIQKKAVYAGAGIVADEIRKSLEETISPYATGDLVKSLGISPIDIDKDGTVNAKIGFEGYDSKGVPNPLKARVLECGKSDQPKRPFIRPAVKKARKAAEEAMEKVIDEEINKIMKK